MSLQVVFLGTSASVPTPKRALPALSILRKGEQLMFDCGEGVQRQMMIAKTGFHDKMKIFVTHMHGDHMLGLPGLLQTMSMLNRERRLDVYGPASMKRFLKCIEQTVQFGLTFPVRVHEIEEAGTVCSEEEYEVTTVCSAHIIPSLAYALIEKPRSGKFYPKKANALGMKEGPLWSELQRGHEVKLPSGQVVKPEDVMGPPRPGRKIVYSGDTRPFDDFVKFAAGADLLIHDCSLDDELAERANEYGHSTPSQAAKIAKKARVKRLILTHISSRYSDTRTLLNQARKVFKNTIVSKDFMRIEIPLLEN